MINKHPNPQIINYNDFYMDHAFDSFPNRFQIFIYTENSDIQPGNEETIWNKPKEDAYRYPFLSADTTLYLSSTDAAANQVWLVNGLNDSYEFINDIVTLNGQNQVQVPTDFFRIYGVFNISATSPAGDVYLAESDTLTGGIPDTTSKIQMKINQDVNIGVNGTHTVRAGHEGYVFQLEGTVGKAKNINLFINLTVSGFAPFKIFPFRIFQSTFTFFKKIGFVMNEQTDLELTVASDDANTPVTAGLMVIEVPV